MLVLRGDIDPPLENIENANLSASIASFIVNIFFISSLFISNIVIPPFTYIYLNFNKV